MLGSIEQCMLRYLHRYADIYVFIYLSYFLMVLFLSDFDSIYILYLYHTFEVVDIITYCGHISDDRTSY